jgi:predicted DNA-binding protein YlxM (UPF0122 family)
MKKDSEKKKNSQSIDYFNNYNEYSLIHKQFLIGHLYFHDNKSVKEISEILNYTKSGIWLAIHKINA